MDGYVSTGQLVKIKQVLLICLLIFDLPKSDFLSWQDSKLYELNETYSRVGLGNQQLTEDFSSLELL